MTMLMLYFDSLGIVPNTLGGGERQVYENRFGMFAILPFPRFKTYDEYTSERGQAVAMTKEQMQDLVKSNMTEGRVILQRLIATESRCEAMLPKE